MNAKRSGRTLVKKQFSDHGKAFEMSTFENQTSGEIYDSLHRELDLFANQGRRKYMLDLREFNALGPFVDWHGLIYGARDA